MRNRKEYQFGKLDESDLDASPFVQFSHWYEKYIESGFPTRNAMTLATASKGASPSARTVLLKEFSKEGFVFFSSYESRKGKELEENPQASLVFFWPEMERQVLIEGLVTRAGIQLSDEYFESRPFDSQVAAFISSQSQSVESRAVLEEEFEIAKEKFQASGFVPRPSHWGGYRLAPIRFEFWQGRENRLNDRLVYEKSNQGKWAIHRLQP